MRDTSEHIRTGFYENFKDYDTLLISVDIKGILEIESAFLELSKGLYCFDFSSFKLLDKRFHVDIKAYNDVSNIGLRQIDKGKFEWRLTKELWNQFREMTSVLSQNNKGGHHYLDFESNYLNSETNFIDTESLQVILSLYEYPFSFWEEHFYRNNKKST